MRPHGVHLENFSLGGLRIFQSAMGLGLTSVGLSVAAWPDKVLTDTITMKYSL